MYFTVLKIKWDNMSETAWYGGDSQNYFDYWWNLQFQSILYLTPALTERFQCLWDGIGSLFYSPWYLPWGL